MRCSVHIDAGYLFGALATRETGSANRGAIDVDVEPLIKAIAQLAQGDSGMRLLRVLWYDAAKDGVPDHHQRKIGLIDSVKLRMGRINFYGEQKGVDLRLGLDLAFTAVNRSAEVAYLISGDDDLSEAVTDAQDLGLQVKLIAVPSADGHSMMAVANNLSLSVDGVLTIPAKVLDDTVHRVRRRDTAPTPAPVGVLPSSAGSDPTDSVAKASDAPAKRPTPADLALKRPASSAPAPAPLYSTSTNSPSVASEFVWNSDQVKEVAESVYSVWSATASSEEVRQLLAARPNVPPQLDRILLVDMVARSGLTDIPTSDRYALRAAFWAAAGQHR